jgi:hypothetical protein
VREDADDKQQNGLHIDDPVQPADYENLFVRLKDGTDIAHGATSLI